MAAVELVIESGAPSAEHVLNVLARLNATGRINQRDGIAAPI